MFWVLYVSDKNNRSKYVLKTGIVAELIVISETAGVSVPRWRCLEMPV